MFGQVLIYGLITATQVLFVALALYVIRLVSRSINLALGGVLTAVAYAFYFGFAQMNWGAASALLFAMLVAAVLGTLNYFIHEPLTRRQQPMLILLSSIALGLALEAVVAIIFNTDGKSLIAGVVPTLHFGEYQIPISGAIIIGGGVLVFVVVALLYFLTPFGRKLRAISENHFAAVSIGIDQPRYRLVAYIVSALIVGLVGILVGLNTALVPTMGFNLLAMGFIALLVGGVADIIGTVVATYLLVLIPELVIGLTPSVSANWRLALVFVLASLFLFFRPNGLFSRKSRMQ